MCPELHNLCSGSEKFKINYVLTTTMPYVVEC